MEALNLHPKRIECIIHKLKDSVYIINESAKRSQNTIDSSRAMKRGYLKSLRGLKLGSGKGVG